MVGLLVVDVGVGVGIIMGKVIEEGVAAEWEGAIWIGGVLLVLEVLYGVGVHWEGDRRDWVLLGVGSGMDEIGLGGMGEALWVVVGGQNVNGLLYFWHVGKGVCTLDRYGIVMGRG